MKRKTILERECAVKAVTAGKYKDGRPYRDVIGIITGDRKPNGDPWPDKSGDVVNYEAAKEAFSKFVGGPITFEHDLDEQGRLNRTEPDTLKVGEAFYVKGHDDRREIEMGMRIDDPVMVRATDSYAKDLRFSWKGPMHVEPVPVAVKTSEGVEVIRNVYPLEVWNTTISFKPAWQGSRIIAVKSEQGIEIKQEVEEMNFQEQLKKLLAGASDEDKTWLMEQLKPAADPPADPKPTDADPVPVELAEATVAAIGQAVTANVEGMVEQVAAKSAERIGELETKLTELSTSVSALRETEIATKSLAELGSLKEEMLKATALLEKIRLTPTTQPKGSRLEVGVKASEDHASEIIKGAIEVESRLAESDPARRAIQNLGRRLLARVG